MKILIVNYRYFLSGGPERYLFTVSDELAKRGHSVIPFSVRNSQNRPSYYSDYFASPIGSDDAVYFEDYDKTLRTSLKVVARLFYSFEVRRSLERLIDHAKPDICYLLHHYNKLSPSVVHACRNKGVPIVMRLSDYFPVCPSALLFRDGQPCEECLSHGLHRSVVNRCVKGSVIGSILKYLAYKFHRAIRVYETVDRVVVPSSFTLNKLQPMFGERLWLLPTFTSFKASQSPESAHTKDRFFLYFGRVEPEKGVGILLEAMKKVSPEIKLKIAGKSSTGFDKWVVDFIENNGLSNVEYVGEIKGATLHKTISNARFIVAPQICYENIPNALLEALALRKAILAGDIGSLSEIVEHNENGILYKWDDLDALAEGITSMHSLPDHRLKEMGQKGLDKLQRDFSKQRHMARLEELFRSLVLHDRSGSGPISQNTPV